MKFKVVTLLPVLCSLFLTLFPSCSSDPVAPVEAFHIADYFSLEAGYSKRYRYDYVQSTRDNIGNGELHGYCTVMVDKIIEEGSSAYATVKVTIQINQSSRPGYGDTTFIRSYDILQTPDSIWYVTGAPSLERLNEGTRTPLMFFREDSSLFADLKMFALDFGDLFQYKNELRLEKLPLKTSGEFMEFDWDTVNYGSIIQKNAVESTVILRRGAGIHFVDNCVINSITSTHSDFVRVKLNLTE